MTAPPEQSAAVVGVGVPEHIPQIVGRDPLARQAGTERTRLLHEGGNIADVSVEPGLRRRMKGVAHRVDRIDPAMRREERVRMRAEDIGRLRLIVDQNMPLRPVFAEQTVHAGNHRPIRIRQADRRRDRVAPVPEFIRRLDDAHAVALIPEVPGGDGGTILQRFNEVTHKSHLPPDRLRIGQHVDPFERRRHVHAA